MLVLNAGDSIAHRCGNTERDTEAWRRQKEKMHIAATTWTMTGGLIQGLAEMPCSSTCCPASTHVFTASSGILCILQSQTNYLMQYMKANERYKTINLLVKQF